MQLDASKGLDPPRVPITIISCKSLIRNTPRLTTKTTHDAIVVATRA